MASEWTTTTLVLLISLLTQNSSGWYQGTAHSTYQLKEPVRIAMDTDQGMITSYLHPDQRLRLANPHDNLICRHFLKNEYTAFLVSPSSYRHVVKRSSPYYPYENKLSRYLAGLSYDGKPWLVFLRTKNIQIPVNQFDNIQLRSGGVSNVWKLDALTMNAEDRWIEEDKEDIDNPENTQSAPPPFYQSLCVGPEFPRPYPVLYSFPPSSNIRPGLSSFSIADLTPMSGH